MEKKQVIFFSLVALALIVVGWLFGHFFRFGSREILQPLRETSTNFKFVEPLLAVGNFDLLRDFEPLKREIEKKARDFAAAGKVSRLSVYYRDLESGRWTGVNEDEKYAPASMYKVALMITLLKAAESDSSLLKTRLVFTGSSNIPGEAEPKPRLHIGESYSITELLEYLIANSDNDAKNLLHTIVSPAARREVFTDLGLAPPDDHDIGNSLSAKAYSIFFRVLFNGTYLSPRFSESALELLSRPEFTTGLVAGLPKEVLIAHKFGRRVFLEKNLALREELHDCGNVYLPDHPYFLCVMTEGRDNAALASVISDLSKTVYNYTTKEYR